MYDTKSKLAAYSDQQTENIGMLDLVIKCLERASRLLSDAFDCMDKNDFSSMQKNIDKVNDIIATLNHSMAQAADQKNPTCLALRDYLLQMQIAFTRANLHKNTSEGKRVAKSLLSVAGTMKNTQAKNRAQKLADSNPRDTARPVTAPQPQAISPLESGAQQPTKPASYGMRASVPTQNPLNISA